MRVNHALMAAFGAAAMSLAANGVQAAASVLHFSFSGDQLVFEKQTGGRNCQPGNPQDRDTCSHQGEGPYMINFVVNGPANGCSLVAMETMGQAESLDYTSGNRVAAVSGNAKSLTIRNNHSEEEDITYEIVYNCGGMEKRWHPVLKNKPW